MAKRTAEASGAVPRGDSAVKSGVNVFFFRDSRVYDGTLSRIDSHAPSSRPNRVEKRSIRSGEGKKKLATSAGFDRTASNVREDPLMRPSLLATALDNSKTKDKNVAKCSATRHGYILAILIPPILIPYAFPTVYIFFLLTRGSWELR